MSCRKATTASTYGMGLSAIFAPNAVGEGFPLPFVENLILLTGGALYEPALCKGRCRAERGGGVVPDLLLFLSCKLQTFTIPQALTRQLPLHKGAFGIVRTSRVTSYRRGRR